MDVIEVRGKSTRQISKVYGGNYTGDEAICQLPFKAQETKSANMYLQGKVAKDMDVRKIFLYK